MLTVDLVRARRKAGALLPSYIRGATRERALPIAQQYLDLHTSMVGQTRDELDAVLASVPVEARDRVTALGLRRVIETASEFEVSDGANPEELRHAVFWEAARTFRALGLREEFDRSAVLADVAARLGTTASAVEAGLYADLRGSEILRSGPSVSADTVVDRYNLGLAQAVLLRATRVEIELFGQDPDIYRRLFRAVRFHQLIHVVRSRDDGSYVIELDGPFSLFDSVQRYGFRLALFLPSVLGCTTFRVRAQILWGKAREPLVFDVCPEDGLVADLPVRASSPVELEVFCAAFERLSSEWKVRPSDRIFALPGEVVCVPDLVFESTETGEEVYLEVFGFWSRTAVWQRVELLRKGFPCRIILAVGKQLRVSEEVLGEDDAGEVYVFKTSLSPRAILERLRGARKEPADSL